MGRSGSYCHNLSHVLYWQHHIFLSVTIACDTDRVYDGIAALYLFVGMQEARERLEESFKLQLAVKKKPASGVGPPAITDRWVHTAFCLFTMLLSDSEGVHLYCREAYSRATV